MALAKSSTQEVAMSNDAPPPDQQPGQSQLPALHDDRRAGAAGALLTNAVAWALRAALLGVPAGILVLFALPMGLLWPFEPIVVGALAGALVGGIAGATVGVIDAWREVRKTLGVWLLGGGIVLGSVGVLLWLFRCLHGSE